MRPLSAIPAGKGLVTRAVSYAASAVFDSRARFHFSPFATLAQMGQLLGRHSGDVSKAGGCRRCAVDAVLSRQGVQLDPSPTILPEQPAALAGGANGT